MTTVTDAIAASLAELTAEQPAPLPPYGYGVDLSCVTEVFDDLRTTNQDSPDGIVESTLRRLITPRGSNPCDPDYGYDLRAALHAGATARQLREIEGRARSEVRKDDRVRDAAVSVTRSAQGYAALDVNVVITPTDPTVEIPAFTFSVENGVVHYARINSR